MKNRNLIFTILIIAVVVVQFIGLFLPFIGDAGKYAAISKNLYLNKDFFNLTIHGSPYYQKPPVLMWLSSFGFYITGTINPFTSRIIPVLTSLLMIWSTFKLANVFYSRNTARMASLFIGTSLIYFLYNTDLHTDVILTTFTTLSIWQIALFIKNNRLINSLGAATFAALAMLSKGPVGLAVPLFALLSHLLYSRKIKPVLSWKIIPGILLLLLLLFPYLNWLYDTFGAEGIKFYIWTNNTGRITGEYKQNNIDPFFYLYNLIVFTLPWALFIVMGLVMAIRDTIKKETVFVKEGYNLGAILIMLIVLSVANMKSPNYFYPIIPLTAVLAANYFQIVFKRNKPKQLKIIYILTHGINAVLILLTATIVFYFFPVDKFYIWLILSLLFISYLIISFSKEELKSKIVYSSIVSILMFFFTINAHLFPELFNYQSTIKAAEIFNREADDDAVFYTYRYPQYEMHFYAKGKGYKVKDEGHQDDPVLIDFEDALADRGAWFLANEYSYYQIKKKLGHLEKEYEFDHYYLTDVNWKFLNPKTRNQVLKKIYLVKTYE